MSDDDEPAYQRYERSCIARGRCVCGKDLSLQGRHLLGCTRSSQYSAPSRASVRENKRLRLEVQEEDAEGDLASICLLTRYTPPPYPSLPGTFNGVTISHGDPITNGIMCLTHADLPLSMIFLRPKTLLVCTRGVAMYVDGAPWHCPIPSVSCLCAVGASSSNIRVVLLGGTCRIAMVSFTDTNASHLLASYRFDDADEISAVAASSQRRVMVSLRRPNGGVFILSWDDVMATFVTTRHVAVSCTTSALLYSKDIDSIMIATEHSGCTLVSLARTTLPHNLRWLPDVRPGSKRIATKNTRFYLVGDQNMLLGERRRARLLETG